MSRIERKKSNSCLHFLSQWESNCRPNGQFLFYGKRQHIAQQINLSRPRHFLPLVRSALIWWNFCLCGWKTAKVAARVIWSCCCKPKVKTSSSLASAFFTASQLLRRGRKEKWACSRHKLVNLMCATWMAEKSCVQLCASGAHRFSLRGFAPQLISQSLAHIIIFDKAGCQMSNASVVLRVNRFFINFSLG